MSDPRITPSASRATQRVTASWSAEECKKMDKYLQKEAAGKTISDEKWENAFSRHNFQSIKAKRRHRIKELQGSGALPPTFPLEKPKDKEKRNTQAHRELFNAVFSGLPPSSSSSSGSSSGVSTLTPMIENPFFPFPSGNHLFICGYLIIFCRYECEIGC